MLESLRAVPVERIRMMLALGPPNTVIARVKGDYLILQDAFRNKKAAVRLKNGKVCPIPVYAALKKSVYGWMAGEPAARTAAGLPHFDPCWAGTTGTTDLRLVGQFWLV